MSTGIACLQPGSLQVLDHPAGAMTESAAGRLPMRCWAVLLARAASRRRTAAAELREGRRRGLSVIPCAGSAAMKDPLVRTGPGAA